MLTKAQIRGKVKYRWMATEMFYLTSALTLCASIVGLVLITVSIYSLSRHAAFREGKYVAVGQMFEVKSVHGAFVLGSVGIVLLGFAVLAVPYFR